MDYAFSTENLIESTVPPDDVVILEENSETDSGVIRCAVCGTPASEGVGLPVGYANPVCDACDALAVNDDTEEPWTGYPPGERPENKSSVIQLDPDHGENPVYIAGVKCWRRYRFGGWITRRDAYDCSSLDEFRERHRPDGRPIHAFNVPKPGGLPLDRDTCVDLNQRYDVLKAVKSDAEQLTRDATEVAITTLHDRLTEIGVDMRNVVDDDSVPPEEAAEWLAEELEYLMNTQWTVTDNEYWILKARLCQRYHTS